jgi:hypothetical protein
VKAEQELVHAPVKFGEPRVELEQVVVEADGALQHLSETEGMRLFEDDGLMALHLLASEWQRLDVVGCEADGDHFRADGVVGVAITSILARQGI